MNQKIKKVFTNFRVIILLICIVLALVAINPKISAEGVAIRNVVANSSATEAGIPQPAPNVRPVARERILSINNKPVKDAEDYYNFVSSLKPNQSIQLKTTKALYKLKTKQAGNETQDLGIRIFNPPKTNIRKGLDLQGGIRVLLQPEKPLPQDDLSSLIDTMQERLNVYGLNDLIIRDATDLSGKQYILVEIAGASEDEIKDLLAKQGKFEAKIGNETVFVGGKDIVFVCKSANCAGIDPNVGCSSSQGQSICRFRFSISITPEAAQKQASITKNLEVIEDNGKYLSEPIVLYLDDTEVDKLNIGAELRGNAATEIQISGSGIGSTQQESIYNAMSNMKRLQTVLITGSLPVQLDIVKIDTISPLLGKEFLRSAIIAGLLALIGVSITLFVRYRKLQVSIPMVFTCSSEVIMLLGVAALIGWNIDIAAIAGIILSIGTGVNHQIVIADEILRGEKSSYNWKEKIKNAFAIILGSYSTVVVALIPLIFAGAGLLKGFAITTILGASIGVFISRPVFATMIEILVKD
ncbi:hypothetical protein HYX01_02525 [Candidatus Woesearchaeota archaeon]|nr:hypothetical protein [Candidatus Woesearchaeota archaeon]